MAAARRRKRATGGEAAEKTRVKARTRDSLQALSKLGELVDGRSRIVSQPPIVVPAREVAATYGMSAEEIGHRSASSCARTGRRSRRSPAPAGAVRDRRRGPQGRRCGQRRTRAFIVLLQGRDAGDPLFLQVKEATASVLEDHLPKSRYQAARRAGGAGAAADAGGQRHLPRLDARAWTDRHFYWRQLRDMKGSGRGRVDDAVRADVLCPHLWVDPGPGTCPVRGPGRDRRIPRPRRRVRPGRSPTSPSGTRSRMKAIFRTSPRRSEAVGCKLSKASDEPIHGRRSPRRRRKGTGSGAERSGFVLPNDRHTAVVRVLRQQGLPQRP